MATVASPATIETEVVSATVTKIYCEGICCPMEVPLIEAALGRMPGVVSVEVAVVTKTVTTRHVPSVASPAALVAALNEARLNASLTFPRAQARGTRSWLPPWYVLIAIGLLLISLLQYLSGPAHARWMTNFKWAALGSVALCLPVIALKALASLRHFVLDIHLLISIAAAGAIALGDYTEAATVVVLFAVADFLESRCTGQARDAIAAVLALKPETAVLATTGAEVSADSVEVRTVILIRSGDKAPLDGVVVEGSSAFDESVLTGESVPVLKHAGDTVRAGTLNAGSGLVQVRTTARAEDTFVAGMARLVAEATGRRSPAEAAVAQFAKIYTPIVLLACILLAFVPWSDPTADKRRWVYLSLQVLVTACPCALVLSTPVTVVSALARAAQVGVLIKGGTVLQALQSVRVITFDKTGTLTRGVFLLESVSIAPEMHDHHAVSEAELLRLLGSLERGSSHPLAAAVVGRAAARGVTCDAPVVGSKTVPGFGIQGIVDGRSIRAGTSEFVEQLSLPSSDRAALAAAQIAAEGRGVTTCYVSVDGRYAACITAKDTLRDEAKEAVATLRALGLVPVMLTGDNMAVATATAAASGIESAHTHAALLPQDKLELVELYRNADAGLLGPGETPSAVSKFFSKLQSTSRYQWSRVTRSKTGSQKKPPKILVAHVGDGINDAPALAAADVGVAMGVAGAAAALEAGDVALFTNDLRVVPALWRLARSAGRTILINITFSVVTKMVVLGLAAAGKFTLWGAVLVDVGTALLVTIHGLKLLRWDFGLGESAAACVGLAASAANTTRHECCGKGSCDVNHHASPCCADGGCHAQVKGHDHCSSSDAEEARASDGSCCAAHDHGHGGFHLHDHHHHGHHKEQGDHDQQERCGGNKTFTRGDGHSHSHGHSHERHGKTCTHDHGHSEHQH